MKAQAVQELLGQYAGVSGGGQVVAGDSEQGLQAVHERLLPFFAGCHRGCARVGGGAALDVLGPGWHAAGPLN
ncbi:hypothetical protein GCM10029976_068560 [Kribbella albertanoniae]